MFDAFSKAVSQADERGEFLSDTQIDSLARMAAEAEVNKRLDITIP